MRQDQGGYGTVLAMAALIAGTCGAFGADPEWARGVQGFEGTFTVRVNQSGAGQASQVQSKWSIFKDVSGRVRLDHWDEDRGAWTGTVTGTATFNHDFTDTTPACVTTMTVKGTSPLVRKPGAQPIQPYLYIHDDGSYTLQFDYAGVAIPSTTTGVCSFGSDTTVMDVSEAWYPDAYHTKPWPRLPDSPGPLKFQGNLPDSFNVQWPVLFKGSALLLDFPAETTWNLTPIGMADAPEAIVEDTFGAFRPSATLGGGQGGTIALKAVLRNKDGSALRQKARLFRWRFVQVSREPGYAMNVPETNPGTDPDFRFEQGGNVVLTSDDGLTAETPEGQYTESAAVVGSYDWGAYGRVQVVAVLEDGREIVGHLEGDPSQTEVRLPKRADGDPIARAWRDAKGAGDRPDNEDNEDAPAGDGHGGDGLTLYEEYRGFIERGTHIEGDPFTKDYFVENRASGILVPGIKLFGSLTRLKVHYRFTSGEVPVDRVINRNYGSAHRVDQHAVRIISDGSVQGYAEARGGPGTPGMITEVAMPAFTGAEAADEISYMSSSLVHELLHTVNVYHHGERLELHVTWAGNAADGYREIVNGVSRPIRVLREDGSAYDKDLGEGRPIVLGQYESPYPGDDNCIMRYDAAKGYLARTDPDLRYRADETTGTLLCSDTRGTGVNAIEHQPQSRFGDAAPHRGNCSGQILVNDGVKAPRR